MLAEEMKRFSLVTVQRSNLTLVAALVHLQTQIKSRKHELREVSTRSVFTSKFKCVQELMFTLQFYKV